MNQTLVAFLVASCYSIWLAGAEPGFRSHAIVWLEAEAAPQKPGIDIDRSKKEVLRRSEAFSDDYFYDPDVAARRLRKLAGII